MVPGPGSGGTAALPANHRPSRYLSSPLELPNSGMPRFDTRAGGASGIMVLATRPAGGDDGRARLFGREVVTFRFVSYGGGTAPDGAEGG
jgi:hypothetical protein